MIFKSTEMTSRATAQAAEKMLAELRRVPGLTDLRIQQPFDYPTYDINVDRTKAAQGGLTERDAATSVLNSLSGSFQITPMFFLNWKNGVNYNLVAQTPQYRVESLQDLENTPITAASTSRPRNPGGCGLDQTLQRNGGDQPLQHSPHRGNLRRGSGSRSGFGRA